MPEPKWNLLWSRQKYPFKRFWLKDNSAIIGGYYNSDTGEEYINIEPIDTTKEIISIAPKFGSYHLFMFDSKGRMYLRVSDAKDDNPRIVRCKINLKEKSLSCEPVLFYKNRIKAFDIFSDNETIVFNIDEDNCIKVKRIGGKEENCITNRPHKIGPHAVISPNDKWMAFTSYYSLQDGRDEEELYIIELKTKQGE